MTSYMLGGTKTLDYSVKGRSVYVSARERQCFRGPGYFSIHSLNSPALSLLCDLDTAIDLNIQECHLH